jgi:hypothetical protein
MLLRVVQLDIIRRTLHPTPPPASSSPWFLLAGTQSRVGEGRIEKGAKKNNTGRDFTLRYD